MIVNPFSYLIEKLKGKVDKSGDTMTGELRINNNNDTPLIIKKSNSSIGKVYLGFENSAETIGYFSVGADKKPYFTSGNGADTQIALMSDIPVPQLTSNPKTGMAGGWYVVWDLSTSWVTDVSLWVQVASGTHVYVWTQNTLVTLA